MIKKDVSTLSVQQMRTFCGVYQSGGYAGAADGLGLTGPTMFEQIKSLERVYGVRLFKRVGRSIEPTDAGTLLYRLLEPLLANIESTLDIVAEQSTDAPKQISLVTGVRMMLEELGQPLRLFHQQYPGVTLRLTTADNRLAQTFVLEGKVDLALLIEPPQNFKAEGVSYQRLYPLDYFAALPPRHRLIRKEELNLSDLGSERLILGTADTIVRQMFEHACFRLGTATRLNIVAETDNSATTIACVRAGLGVGIIAGRRDGNLARHVTVRLLTKDIGQVQVVAAYRSGRQLTQTIQSLIRHILNESQDVSVIR
jgi:DNA-binding transcriptional LysR family regulator